MEITEILFLGLFIVVGILMIFFSIKIFKKIQLVRQSDEVSIREAVNRDDIIQINGKAKKHKDVLNSPLENEECFAYEYTVEKRQRKRKRSRRRRGNRSSKWKIIENGDDSTDFILEDNSGTAYINTDTAETSLDNGVKYTMSNSSSIPSTVADNNNLSFNLMGFNFAQKLRLREGTIQPDDDIFIIGKYNSRNVKNNETVEIDAEETIYISDKSTKQEIRSLIIRCIIFGIIGSMFILLPSVILLSELGIL